ncbi:MAG: YbaY family lipoprotein [Defluviicoccus sp.]|nr:MAG: YbaY family lipoprotein [Defluviicoccus sp.]
MALPKDALVVVRLVELSGGSSARAVASEHGFLAQGQVPIDFRLPYDPSLVSPEYSYGIEAYIFVDGALWFMTAQPVAVLTQGLRTTPRFYWRWRRSRADTIPGS